jgi:Lrp/AsnC family leucine-responsive transcriptional regulator
MVEITKLKVDKTDRRILAELDRNCRVHSSKIAKLVHKSRHSVEYRINQLGKKGVITSFNASINPHKMGRKIYKVYIKLRNIPKEKERLFEYLKSSGLVYWMGECSGTWDLIFGIIAKTDQEFYNFKNEFMSKFNKIILEQRGEIMIDVKQYPKMYFTNEFADPVMFAGEVVDNKLDELDYAVLGEIVNKANVSLVELARKTKSTPIVVKSRLAKLEQKGIIIQYRIGIDLNKLGLELYKTLITLDRYNEEDQKKLLNYLSQLPYIHYLIQDMWNIEVELVVSNYQEYYQIIENLKREFPDIIRTADSVLMITDEWTPGFKNLLKLPKAKAGA